MHYVKGTFRQQCVFVHNVSETLCNMIVDINLSLPTTGIVRFKRLIDDMVFKSLLSENSFCMVFGDKFHPCNSQNTSKFNLRCV